MSVAAAFLKRLPVLPGMAACLAVCLCAAVVVSAQRPQQEGDNGITAVALRGGHHCAQPLSRTVICKQGTVRASCYLYNTLNEIDTFVSAMKEIVDTMTA